MHVALPSALMFGILLCTPARADFTSCVAALRSEAAAGGVSQIALEKAFAGLAPDMKVLEFQKDQPEFKTPIWDYLSALVDEERVSDGKAAMANSANALASAEARFGVDRHVVAAVWGVESNYGKQMGKRPLVQSLSTLACFGERAAYFRSELMATLKIITRGDIAPEQLNGSWAGAFGQTQFMPSTYLRLAVDGDGDGRANIVDSTADAVASTANYLAKGGWVSGEPWGFEVKLPLGYSGPSGRRDKQSMSAWAARGLTRIDGGALGSGSAGLLLPAGVKGPAFLVTHNFEVIFSYNAAESYALAIALLSDRLAGGRGLVAAWPTNDPGLSRADRRKLMELLNKRGYDVGEANGAVGALTKAAIADFETKSGMTADGRPSRAVLDLLEK